MGILMVASIVTTLVMWIIALIQAASREDLKNNKVLWIILIIFVSPIGPIIYFFVEGRKKYGWITLVAALATPIVLSVYAIQAFTSDQLQSAIQADSQNVIEVQLPTEN
jgi:hypothetical protein